MLVWVQHLKRFIKINSSHKNVNFVIIYSFSHLSQNSLYDDNIFIFGQTVPLRSCLAIGMNDTFSNNSA